MEFTPAVIEDLIYLAAALYAAIKFGSNSVSSLLNRWLDKIMDPMKANFDGIKDILDKSMEPEIKKAQSMSTYFNKLNKRHDEMEKAEPLVSCPRCGELCLEKPDPDCLDCGGTGLVALKDRRK
jgi:hypothetical protein